MRVQLQLTTITQPFDHFIKWCWMLQVLSLLVTICLYQLVVCVKARSLQRSRFLYHFTNFDPT